MGSEAVVQLTKMQDRGRTLGLLWDWRFSSGSGPEDPVGVDGTRGPVHAMTDH